MRIIAGILGGRQFDAPKGHRTHPMSEKARGGLFNALGDMTGLTVLDCFAGSGALSFEAASRGAAKVIAIDIDAEAHVAMNKSIRKLGVEGIVKSIRANVSSWSDNNTDVTFDIVICDPPYDNVRPELLTKLANHVEVGGIIVFSIPPDENMDVLTVDYSLLTSKSYGDARLMFYRRII